MEFFWILHNKQTKNHKFNGFKSIKAQLLWFTCKTLNFFLRNLLSAILCVISTESLHQIAWSTKTIAVKVEIWHCFATTKSDTSLHSCQILVSSLVCIVYTNKWDLLLPFFVLVCWYWVYFKTFLSQDKILPSFRTFNILFP